MELNNLQSIEIAEIHTALSKAQSDIPTLFVDSSGYSGKYVSLPGIIAHIRKPLTDNGLSYTQEINEFDGKYFLITTLRHSSGQWIRCKSPLFLPSRDEIPSNKDYNQECGKAISYMRRYSLESLLGLKGDKDDFDNDDGNSNKNTSRSTSEPRKESKVSITEVQIDDLIERLKQYNDEDSDLLYRTILQKCSVKDLEFLSEKQYHFVISKILN